MTMLVKSGAILIGDFAINAHAKIHTNIKPLEKPRLQIISDKSPDDIKNSLEKELKAKCKYVHYDLNLPVDMELKKYTFYIINGNFQSPLFDMYNTITYDIVPIISDSDNVLSAGLFAIMRFKLIDLFSLRLILNLPKSNNKLIISFIREIIEQTDTLRTSIAKILENNPLDIFKQSYSDYRGVYISDSRRRKKLTAEHRFKFSKYYPTKNQSLKSS